jgi:hypothetical protein
MSRGKINSNLPTYVASAVWEQRFCLDHFSKMALRTHEEAALRASIFARNVAAFKEHNEKFARGEVSYTKGINQFTDMTEKEILEHINCGAGFDANIGGIKSHLLKEQKSLGSNPDRA